MSDPEKWFTFHSDFWYIIAFLQAIPAIWMYFGATDNNFVHIITISFANWWLFVNNYILFAISEAYIHADCESEISEPALTRIRLL